MVAADFAPGARGPRATSYLEAITDSVRNANLIQRATFPWEWLPQAVPTPLSGTAIWGAPNQLDTTVRSTPDQLGDSPGWRSGRTTTF